MPRSGPPSFTYTLPAIYLAIPGTTITAAQHNDPLQDIAATFNTVQPVVLGGTGASNAGAARANLGLVPGTDFPTWNSVNVWTAANTFALADDGAGAGPIVKLDRVSASPAASDLLGELPFTGRDSGGTATDYAVIGAEITDPADTAEAGGIFLQTALAGTLARRLNVRAGIYTANATGGDKGADTINAAHYYQNNLLLLPYGLIYGLGTANNGADGTNDIDVAAGYCVDSTNTVLMQMATGLTKRLDATWVAGNGNGGRFVGSISNSTWHVFVIFNPTTGVVDSGFSTNLNPASDPNYPSGFTYYRRIWSIIRAGGSIRLYTQLDDECIWSAQASDQAASSVSLGTSAITLALTVPLGIVVNANLALGIQRASSTTQVFMLVTSLTSADTTPSITAFTVSTNLDTANAASGSGAKFVKTDTSGQIRFRLSSSSANIGAAIQTVGYIDSRGRLG